MNKNIRINRAIENYFTHIKISQELFFFMIRQWTEKLAAGTEENIEISPNFLVWKFHGKKQSQSFEWIAQGSTKTVPFQNVSHKEIRWDEGILRSVKLEISSRVTYYSMDS